MAEKTTDQPINHKTCVLKASIHCEGCKRKVKKILSQVHGVTFVDVDTKLQKVTITVSDNVEADVLINKLVKAGKHAELWPEKRVEKKDNFSGFGKSREELSEKTQRKTEIDRQQTKPTSDINVVKEIDPSGKVELVQHPTSSGSVIENGEKTGSAAKVEDGGARKGNEESTGGVTSGKVEVVTDASVKSSSSGVKETESVGKKTVEDSSAGGEPPKAAEKGDSSGGNEVGSTAGKKKKKKGQNGNLATTVPSSAATPGGTGSENYEPGLPLPCHQIPPRHHDLHQVPTNNFYIPPSAVYGVSYNTSHPPSSYTASYYSTPPPYSYAYTYPGRECEPPPSDHGSHPQETLDSFELFSDENPNGCSIA